MKLFLCSHFSSVGSLIKEEIENKKVAFIPTASLREGYTGYVGSARKLFKKLGAIVTEIDISTEAYSTIQSVFEDADVIYFTGGNSFFLIDQLRKTGTDELLKKELAKGKLMIGESAGVVLTALGLYEPLVKLAGAGATVPLTGFGYALGNGAIEAAKESGVIGAFTGGITATAGGVAAAIVFGYLNALLFTPKTKM